MGLIKFELPLMRSNNDDDYTSALKTLEWHVSSHRTVYERADFQNPEWHKELFDSWAKVTEQLKKVELARKNKS
jgi:hypothetical protein